MEKTTALNPIIWADYPDPDLIRVGDSYYMVSTSMHTMPGCPIMKSEDLVNWEVVNYVYDSLENNSAHNLQDGKGIYGQGSWAASLKYHKGIFYLCFNSNDMEQFYIYKSDDIENGEWERSVIERPLHDPALFFDKGKAYIIYGCGDIKIVELNKDLSGLKKEGKDELLLKTPEENMALRCEGCHAYKIKAKYYLLFIEWPENENQRRRQICYRADSLFGDYERKIILDDDLGYYNNGIAQGGIVTTPAGKYYALLMQDHGAVGRVPHLLEVEWKNGWPIIGGSVKVAKKIELELKETPIKPYVISDDFEYEQNKLDLNWQWNHNPDNSCWSVRERPGFLRLKTAYIRDSILLAPNTLTQRTEGPGCTADVLVDISAMKKGDHAGLVALQDKFGTVGVQILENKKKMITMTVNDGSGKEKILQKKNIEIEKVYLKIDFNFKDNIDNIDNIDIARFYYSTDNQNWIKIGPDLKLEWTMDHFMGCRIGLFNYASIETGGYVDFAYFNYKRKWN